MRLSELKPGEKGVIVKEDDRVVSGGLPCSDRLQ